MAYDRYDHDERSRWSEDRNERGWRGDNRGGRDERGFWDRASDEVASWFGDEDAERRRRLDQLREGRGYGQGKFRGRGPKNYRRSDERVREEICDRLTDNEWLDASDVEVNVIAADAILTGTVDSRYAKRLAETIAESVSGVTNVQNNLRVQSYQADMDAALPAPASPATDITVTNDVTDASGATDAGAPGRSSSRAAGRN